MVCYPEMSNGWSTEEPVHETTKPIEEEAWKRKTQKAERCCGNGALSLLAGVVSFMGLAELGAFGVALVDLGGEVAILFASAKRKRAAQCEERRDGGKGKGADEACTTLERRKETASNASETLFWMDSSLDSCRARSKASRAWLKAAARAG
jgi:hypothetical protein